MEFDICLILRMGRIGFLSSVIGVVTVVVVVAAMEKEGGGIIFIIRINMEVNKTDIITPTLTTGLHTTEIKVNMESGEVEEEEEGLEEEGGEDGMVEGKGREDGMVEGEGREDGSPEKEMKKRTEKTTIIMSLHPQVQ